MFKVASFIGAAAFVASLTARVNAESHNVNLINNCGSGNAVFTYGSQGQNTFGSGTYDRLLGGIAWIDGFAGANCQFSGVNCAIVEFSLTNPDNTDGNTQNSADYSLLDGNDPQTGVPLGNHKFTYAMNFRFTGSSTNAAPGQCTGEDNCPGAFLGSATTGGAPVQSSAFDSGIEITFC